MASRTRPLRLMRYLGLILLAVLIAVAGPRRLLAAARGADPWWLLLAWALNLPQLSLKAFRWYLMLRWQRINLSFGRALASYLGSLLVGFLTPGRVGEMAKAVTLRYEANVPMARALSSVVVDRIFDMYLLLALGGLGVLRFAIVGTRLSWPAFIGCCVLLALPLLFLQPRIARRAGAFAAELGPLRKRRAWVIEKANEFADGLSVISPLRILICGALTVCSYSIFFLQCFCCMWALGFTVPARDLVLLQSAANFLSFIPVAPSGLGTREYALTYFLARVDPPQPVTMAVAYGLSLFLVLFVGGGLLGFIAWQWAPIGLHKAWEDLRRARRATSVARASDES